MARLKNMMEEVAEEKDEAEKPGDRGKGDEGRKRGGAMKKRTRGGVMKGEASEARPDRRARGGVMKGEASEARHDRRARGGATSDLNPTTAAGKMSMPEYERQQKGPGRGGIGADNAGKNG